MLSLNKHRGKRVVKLFLVRNRFNISVIIIIA